MNKLPIDLADLMHMSSDMITPVEFKTPLGVVKQGVLFHTERREEVELNWSIITADSVFMALPCVLNRTILACEVSTEDLPNWPGFSELQKRALDQLNELESRLKKAHQEVESIFEDLRGITASYNGRHDKKCKDRINAMLGWRRVAPIKLGEKTRSKQSN